MPIPDRLSVSGSGEWLFDEGGGFVATIEDVDRTSGESRAIARRLAALWNALRGIPTEAIEAVAAQPTDLGRMNALARVPFPAESGPEAGGEEMTT